MYYISLVRNLTNVKTKDTKAIETLRKHILKSKVDHQYVYTYEISPANNTHHIHGMIIVKELSNLVAMGKYIDTHHLKAYVDKWHEIPNGKQSTFYYQYMHKDITKESKLYIDMIRSKSDIWTNSYSGIVKPWIETMYEPKQTINIKDPDDIFVDSDTLIYLK